MGESAERPVGSQRFTDENIDRAPNAHGVYELYDGAELIYIGRAAGDGVSMRSRLRDHKSGREGDCTTQATHFHCIETEDAESEEGYRLGWQKATFGKLPRCNERVG